MRGIDELKTIDDYYEEINAVEKEMRLTSSMYVKNKLMRYLFYLKKEVKDYLKFTNK